MKTTVKGHVHCSDHDVEVLSIFNCDMTSYGYINLAEFEVEVDLPPLAERTTEAIKMLRAQQKRVEEAAAEKIAQIEDEIRAMAQLTYQGETA